MTEELNVKEVKATFITAANLTEVKRQYYELDLINEYTGKRWVFMIPISIFNATILSKRVVKPQIIKLLDRDNNKEHAQMTI